MQPVFPPRPPVLVPIVGGTGGFPVRRIYCVGQNYEAHAREMGAAAGQPPFFFMKPGDAAVPVPAGTTGEIPYPPLTHDFHHEVELVVAIGRQGRALQAEEALACVFGYAVGLDMTRRDLQHEARRQGRPWSISKGFDASAPLGPITPAAQVPQIASAAIELTVNGATRQRSTLAHMIWKVGGILEHLSRAWTLEPGDLVFTGTPEGVGAVSRGDVLEAHIAGLADLRVRIA